MIEQINNEDLEFFELLHEPLCFFESLFYNFDNLSMFKLGEFGHIRLGQIPILPYEFTLFPDPNLDEKTNFALLEGAGNCYVIGGRNWGKTLCEKLDIIYSLVIADSWPMGLCSYDAIHIRGVLEPIIDCFDNHDILKQFKKFVKRSPSYLIATKSNNVLDGINMNLASKDSGSAFFQKHLKKLLIEECCVDARTKIRFLEEGKLKTKNISYLINSGKWKNVRILSYNLKKRQIEFKKITKIFKKQVKNYTKYKLYIDTNRGSEKTTLIVSPKQKIWCNNQYKYPHQIKKGDSLFLLDHPELTDLSQGIYTLYPVKVLSVEKEQCSSWTMYDFEVEDNHNFFGNGLLISNSFENDEVYRKRVDARHELGCIEKLSGMTNFTKYSPTGRVFYDLTKRSRIVNNPQYVNPFWDEKEKKKAIKKYRGENSLGYRIFVKGEVVEDSVSVFDMSRIRPFYVENRKLKNFEVPKKHFSQYKQILDRVERPSHCSQAYLCADIGESAPTEIIVLFQFDQIFKYIYSITLFSLTDREQSEILLFLIGKLQANIIALDTTDGTGRAIYRRLEEKIPKENLVWVSFNAKIPVDFEKDEFGVVQFNSDGTPKYQEEYVSEWSVQRLKDILYEGIIEIPEDAYKFDSQVNAIVATMSGMRKIYSCLAEEDHLFQAFQVFAIAHWYKEGTISKPARTKKFCKSGV